MTTTIAHRGAPGVASRARTGFPSVLAAALILSAGGFAGSAGSPAARFPESGAVIAGGDITRGQLALDASASTDDASATSVWVRKTLTSMAQAPSSGDSRHRGAKDA